MSEHLNARGVELYYRRALPSTELLEANAHLSSCATCRQLLREREGVDPAFQSLRADFQAEERAELEHPSYAQFTAYADNQLDEVDREILETHLSVCSQCAEIMQDLREFVATPAPLPVVEKKAALQPTLWERFLTFWHSQTDWMTWQLAGAAAALLLFVGIGAAVWISLRGQTGRDEIARTNPSPEITQTPQPTQTPVTTPTPVVVETPVNTNNTNAKEQEQREPQNQQAPPAKSVTASENPTVLALKDGAGLITVDSKGNVNGLESLAPPDQQAVKKALTTQKVETPSMLASLVASVGVLRSGATEGISFPIVSPVGTAVMTKRPTLRWGALPGATSYVVSVFDRNFKKVAVSQPQSGTKWTLTPALEQGGVYTWQVTAIKDSEEIRSPEPPAPEAKFIILEDAQAEELMRARQTYAGSHLALGTLYARAGLLDDAEREFQALLRDNPKSQAARKLLRSVQAIRNSK